MCMELVSNMKRSKIEPNLDTYNHLLRALAHYNRGFEAWAILEDMLLVGIRPDVNTFNHLIEVSSGFHIRFHSFLIPAF